MGLIKMAKDAVSGVIGFSKDVAGSVLKDQFLEFFYCPSLPDDVLMVKGEKQITKGQNRNKGTDNIISNGSIISVNVGQFMIIVDQGRIVDFCAEPGEFQYDASTEPSLFYGNLGENIKTSFQQFMRRASFGGNTGKDQRVYYINTKEIKNNLYGTATPIPFRVFDKNTGFDFDTNVKCNGRYSFKITNPILFYTNVCANIEGTYKSADLLATMKDELLTAMQPAMANIAMKGVRPYELSSNARLLCEALSAELSSQWKDLRGIEMVTMTINADIPQEDRERLTKWQETAILTNSAMAEARKVEAFTGAMEDMGKGAANAKGGSSGVDNAANMMSLQMMNRMMGGTMGMNGAMDMNGGMMGMNPMMGQQPMMNQQMQPMQPASTVAEGAILGWTCFCGKADNRGKFCVECGLPKPALDGWTCSCGKVNQGKFCMECGKKKPEGAPLYRCDKCGWEPEDPANPPKFCPECGDVFDDNDIK